MIVTAIALTAISTGWKPIPFRTEADRIAGRAGGEGGQVILGLAASQDGKFLLMGVDVAGIYRSLDGGASWSPATVGFTPRGACAVAIDPRNARHCLAIGANSAVGDFHGPWLSRDGAASWTPTSLRVKLAGHQDSRDQLAFDSLSFDGKQSQVVYWSRVRDDNAGWGTPEKHPAIYISRDGGANWSELPGSAVAAGGVIRCHPTRSGVVYAAGELGIYVSEDFGKAWRLVRPGKFEGLDVSAGQPKGLWANTGKDILRSLDEGKTWFKLSASAIAEDGYVLKNIHVSPVNADNLVIWRNQEPNRWDWRRYASSDGGRSWTQASFDNSGAFLPYNVRGASFVWSPLADRKVWSVGGDWPTVSLDGGMTYRYSGAGDNAVLVGGMWNFCHGNPNTVFFGSQDYNGAITTNGGASWRYCNVSGQGWGGFAYGGYAVTPRFLVVGDADGWGGKRRLKVSKDGGGTWRDTGIDLEGPDVSFGVAGDPNVAFAKNHRTVDGGTNWRKMADCDGVFADGEPGEVLGVKGRSVVRSVDRGQTWEKVADTPDEVRDIAFDRARHRVYAVIGDRAAYWNGQWTWLDLPKNQFGGTNARSVAVDPVDPRVVYVASAANIFSTSVALVRSSDAGKTWTNLTRTTPLAVGELDGGRESLCVRVHPLTREAWVSTSCYGLWKYSAPRN